MCYGIAAQKEGKEIDYVYRNDDERLGGGPEFDFTAPDVINHGTTSAAGQYFNTAITKKPRLIICSNGDKSVWYPSYIAVIDVENDKGISGSWYNSGWTGGTPWTFSTNSVYTLTDSNFGIRNGDNVVDQITVFIWY